jgi:heme-degrading monooxygenase HmoA
VKLRAWSSRGTWDGCQLQAGAPAPAAGPIAALTRASIALRKAPAFWRYAPAAQSALDTAPGCQLAVGLGEAPLLRQATFTIWDSVSAMDAYARSGAHQNAIQAAYGNQYFSESLFARFVILGLHGNWKGRMYPLAAKASDGLA